MADVVNLRQARKAKAREEAEKKAGANRVKFGLSRADKEHALKEKSRAARALEGHKREDDTGDPC